MNELIELVFTDKAIGILRALIILLSGFFVAKIASAFIGRILKRYLDQQQHMLLKRAVFYFIIIMFVISALRELGFKLSILLGTAGIFSVAIGFASQTSMTNLISGLFLIGERSFGVGDIIKIGDTLGEVLAIDLLSVKLRTFANLYVRIPNETVIKAEVVNLSKFPIRRIDITIGVAYKENIEKVHKILIKVAKENPLALEEPEPLFIFKDFGDSSINLQFSVWVKKENFLDLKNTIQQEIKQTFDKEGIEIPFPHTTIYTGSVTEPFPIKIIGIS